MVELKFMQIQILIQILIQKTKVIVSKQSTIHLIPLSVLFGRSLNPQC